MSHMVIFQAPGGSPGYNQFESLDEAVAFVESLRNDQNVTNARMFALEEIKFELKPFFKVELQALTAGDPSGQAYQGEPAADAAPTESAFGAPVAEDPPQEAPAPAPEPAPAPPVEPEPAPAPAPDPLDEPVGAQPFTAFSDPAQPPAPEAPPAAPPEAPAAPAAPAPAAPAPQPEPPADQPVRRGLFGR